MKQFIREFVLRGLVAAGGGPVVLAIIYGVLGETGVISALSPREVCLGIISVSLLAFIVAGMNAVFQLEQLPLMFAIAIHGAGLYAAYILIYLLNGWLRDQLVPILVFTAVFLACYGVIWLFIYAVTTAKARRINAQLHANR